MIDLIKRSDAIKAVGEPFTEELWDGVLRSIRDVVAVLKDIPSAEPKQGEWIPCSERLPSVFQKAVVCNIHGEMMIGTYTEFGWVFPCYFEKPIAWMPLPEPYPWEGADDE